MLTQREQQIFDYLWKSPKGLTAKEIVDASDISMNTVQAILKRLYKQKLIEIADIVHSGTVLCRVWKPAKGSDELIAMQLVEHYQKFQHIVPKQMFLDVLKPV